MPVNIAALVGPRRTVSNLRVAYDLHYRPATVVESQELSIGLQRQIRCDSGLIAGTTRRRHVNVASGLARRLSCVLR